MTAVSGCSNHLPFHSCSATPAMPAACLMSCAKEIRDQPCPRVGDHRLTLSRLFVPILHRQVFNAFRVGQIRSASISPTQPHGTSATACASAATLPPHDGGGRGGRSSSSILNGCSTDAGAARGGTVRSHEEGCRQEGERPSEETQVGRSMECTSACSSSHDAGSRSCSSFRRNQACRDERVVRPEPAMAFNRCIVDLVGVSGNVAWNCFKTRLLANIGPSTVLEAPKPIATLTSSALSRSRCFYGAHGCMLVQRWFRLCACC